jgi:response regulator RpfG family c-di-GMP phosphodiesterase
MAQDIALYHHEKWDGQGYTGTDQSSLAGQEIPLAARITAIADVYDALCSKRCYKEAWSSSDAVHKIIQDSGTHFDPELVDCFLHVLETIEAIRVKYPDLG